MAKDDYDVIAYRILTYLYACMKRKTVFDPAAFQAAVRKDAENDEYFTAVLRMMQEEGLIQGLMITKVWGNTYVLVSDVRDAEITADGIHYLKENGRMKAVGKRLKEAADIIADLASIAGLFA